ncbi:MAG: adenylate/guanylate cyclase domain-containing protein [Pseudomonadota bacterium]
MSKFIKSQHTWLSSGKDYNALPESIRSSIKQQQDSSERLIGWIQIAILTTFAALYITAPKTIPTGAEFEPVPLFLGAYFLFTCLRLILAYRNSLPFWFLVVSVLVDMGLLLGLIWSFHLQYMQPAAFYLKAPTLLYIFIFIALRALRFEPGFILLSGLVGATGWMALVILAVSGESGMDMITRNYVEYLTSNSVLLGGEMDKVISILVVTAVLTVAVARARHLLIQSIVEESSAKNLSHFVPEGIADRIATAEGPLIDVQSESREASILFIDLVSFTSLGEQLSPDELITTINEYFSVISEPIESNKGVINQFQGDAILASFNLPSKDNDHASSAVTAAIEIQDKMTTHRFSSGIQLKTRIGINTGTVVGGFVGTDDRLSYTVYGDNVNIAARMEQLNKNYGTSILVSERTRDLCDHSRFVFNAKGSEVLRGRKKPVSLFEPETR